MELAFTKAILQFCTPKNCLNFSFILVQFFSHSLPWPVESHETKISMVADEVVYGFASTQCGKLFTFRCFKTLS